MTTTATKYEIVIGLEVHAQLSTTSKLFSGDATSFGAAPNTHTSPIILGHPGTLPKMNERAIEMAVKMGLVCHSEIEEVNYFARKHYFYPDLPKGYQVSQHTTPICKGGFVTIRLNGQTKQVYLNRIHLEEDAAKSFHSSGGTLIDYNKSGMSLVEIVTKPVFESALEAVEFSKKIQDIVRTLGIADVDMEKGQLRLEANISVRTTEMLERGELPNYKVEVKNINSFRFLEKAINYEIQRQSEALEKGEILKQENRGFNEVKGITVLQRKKEEAKDYRYFPDPDLPPMNFADEYIEDLRKGLPILPDQMFEELKTKYSLNDNQARFFTNGDGLDLYGKFISLVGKIEANKLANTLINKPEFRDLSNDEFISKMKSLETPEIPEDRIITAVENVLKNETDAVEKLKAGKESILMFLVGQVMKELKAKVDSSKVIEIIKTKL
jgi:aspartyl-tRNA(Asn)/glutamyl-tRNA(Gln) amidotransferase subunit B